MQVKRLLSGHTKGFLRVGPDDTVLSITRMFEKKRAGIAVVCDAEDRVAGVVSLGDIVHAIGERGAGALELPVRLIMTLDVVTCSPDDEIETAVQRMTELGVRHLPVITDGKVIEVIEKREALEMLYDLQMLDFQQLRNYIFKTGGRY
jgi:CBS domain-containing protein